MDLLLLAQLVLMDSLEANVIHVLLDLQAVIVIRVLLVIIKIVPIHLIAQNATQNVLHAPRVQSVHHVLMASLETNVIHVPLVLKVINVTPAPMDTIEVGLIRCNVQSVPASV